MEYGPAARRCRHPFLPLSIASNQQRGRRPFRQQRTTQLTSAFCADAYAHSKSKAKTTNGEEEEKALIVCFEKVNK
jgi:hypothetical protein